MVSRETGYLGALYLAGVTARGHLAGERIV